MIVLAIVVTLLLMGVLFLLYRGFQLVLEDFKITRELLKKQHKEMIAIIKDFDVNVAMILGSELGDNLKKFIKLKGKGNMVIRKGKVVPVDEDY